MMSNGSQGRWMAIFLCFMIRGTEAQTPTSSTELFGSTLEETLIATSTSMLAETLDNTGTSESVSTSRIPGLSTQFPDDSLNKSMTTAHAIMASRGLSPNSQETSSSTTQSNHSFTIVHKDASLDDAFTYDYESLRYAGLTVAAIFFLMGILVLGCSKVCQKPKCHLGTRKSYQVTRG